MTVRRLTLTGLLSLCATVAAMLFTSVPALAAEEHPYLESQSLIGIHSKASASACGVVTDKFGDVYVSDFKAKEVEVYSASGKKLTAFSFKSTEKITEGPCGLAVDGEGDVYVEEFNGQVTKNTPSAFPPTESATYALDETAGEKGVIVKKAGKAHAIAVDPATQDLYVATSSHISSYEPSGKLISATLGENLVAGANYYGLDVYGANGDVYVTDTAHARAYVLNSSGTAIVAEITGAGSPIGLFENGWMIFNLAVDQSDGDVYVYLQRTPFNGTASAVDEFNASGGYISQIGNEFGSSLHLQDFEPADVAVDNGASSLDDGDVFVASKDGFEADSVYAFGPLAAASEFPLSVDRSGEGSVTSEPPGISCGLVCEASFAANTKVKLTETPESGSTFAGWSGGGCSGTASTCEVTMSSAQTVQATFNVETTPKDKLTIATAGAGTGKVECEVASNAGHFETCASEYPQGTKLTLKGVAEAGSSFAGFSGGSGSASACGGTGGCSITLSQESSLTATFNVLPKDKLTIATAGAGTGKVECELASNPGHSEACASEYAEGTKLTLKGVAEAGSAFAGFSGGSGSAASCSGTGACSFTLGEESALTATFNVVPKDKLTIATAGAGTGKVECEVASNAGHFETCASEYPQGTKLTLKGVAEAGSSFAGFSGGSGSAASCSGTGACSFTLSEESALTATFNVETTPKEKLTIATTGSGSGKVECEVESKGTFGTCASEYPQGTELTLKGVAEPGSSFVGFSGGSGSAARCSGENCSLKLRTESSLTARFVVSEKFTIASAGKGSGKVECQFESSGSFGMCASEYPEGTKLTLKGVAETGSTFAGFSGGGSAASCSGTGACSFTLSEESSLSATFDVLDKLTIAWAGEGLGRVACQVQSSGEFEPCASEYLEGTKLTLEGVADAGSSFAGFSGGAGSAAACSGTPNCTFTLNAETSLTGRFDLQATPQDRLTIAIAGSGAGNVECEVGSSGVFGVCASEYPDGAELTLKGVAQAASSFAGWSGGSGSASRCSGVGDCSFTLSADGAVTATFNAQASNGSSQSLGALTAMGSSNLVSFSTDTVSPVGTRQAAGSLTARDSAAVVRATALLRLNCSSAGPCRGRLTLSAKLGKGHKAKAVVIGRASYALAANQSETVRVKLSRAAARRLRHRRRAVTTLTAPGLSRTVIISLAN